MRSLRFLAIFALLPVFAAAHDDLTGTTGGGNKLAFILPNLFGTGGLTLPNPDHVAHFDSAFRESFTPFNSAIASQLTALPLPSPASGFIYTVDPALGVANQIQHQFRPHTCRTCRNHR